MASAQFAQGQGAADTAAPLAEDRDVAELVAQLLFTVLGFAEPVREHLQQVPPLALAGSDADAAAVVVFSRIRMSQETCRPG